MVLGPVDIEHVEFKVTRLKEGYDQDEVDNFLDRVADSLRSALSSNGNLESESVRLRQENATLKRQLEASSEAPTQQIPLVQPEPTAAAGRLLELAQKTADEVIAKAQAEAVEIQKRADANARDTLSEAVAEGNRRKQAAEAAAYQAEQQLSKIKETRDTLRNQLDAQLSNLRSQLGE